MNKSSPGSEESGEDPVGSLLDQLSSRRAEAAWAEFLKRYSPLIMQLAREFAVGNEQVNDCFLFACEGLSDDAFRRLRSFRSDGPARFHTWLKTVVSHLCVDWLRKQHGRARPFAAVANLPELEQAVYRHIYLRGQTRADCHRVLASRFPGLTLEQVSEVNARLFKRLSSRQRWHMGQRLRASVSLDDALAPDDEGPALQPEDPRPGPEQLAGESRSREAIGEALSKLAPRQRLLLRLRFEQDLTLEQVARLVGLPDPYKTHREVQAAVRELARHLGWKEP